MCGINGVTKNDRALVERMNDTIRHRGPDGSRIWEGEGVTLGHNRLAIIDLSDRALQPMKSTDGRYQIVFNGEIYNYRELKDELRSSYSFTTESDTEVLLAAYTVWGEAMLPRLRGIFAFGIWDTHNKTLLLVRDHMGVKPLYYSYDGETLSFSSELQALARGGTLDREAVALFLELQYVPSSRTFVEHIQKLPPGYLLRYKKGSIVVEAYYDHLQSEQGKVTGSLYTTIDAAVRRQLVSERPIGVFLSGGFDSSIVLHHVQQAQKNVKTFSIGFDGEGDPQKETEKYNADARLAQITARHYGTDHTTFTLGKAEVAEHLESIYQTIDEPVSTATSVSQYFLNKWVRESGVVVAFGGDGGDELFGGYTRHRALMAAHLFQKLPAYIQQAIGFVHPRGKKLQTPFFTPIHLELMATNDSDVRQALVRDIDTMGVTRRFFDDKYKTIPPGMHPLEVYMRVDRHTWLADHSLTRSDRTSMIHGIEFRVPLLDLDVVSYADTVSAYKKTGVFTGKKILRDAYRNHLPQHLYNEPKRGWLSPGAKWLRHPKTHAVISAILSSEYYNGLDQLFDWKSVQKMLDAHVKGEHYAFHPLWSILILQIWSKEHNIRW